MKIQLPTIHENRRVNAFIGVHVRSIAPCESGLRVKRTRKKSKEKKSHALVAYTQRKRIFVAVSSVRKKRRNYQNFRKRKRVIHGCQSHSVANFRKKSGVLKFRLIVKLSSITLSTLPLRRSRYNQATVTQAYGRFVNMVLVF